MKTPIGTRTNHPWLIASFGSILAAILSEASPLRLFSRHVMPWISKFIKYMITPIGVPLWVLPTISILSISLLVVVRYMSNRIRARTTKMLYGEILWNLPKDPNDKPWPVCNKCGLPLLPKTVEEERFDKLMVPYRFTPDYANSLCCANCGLSTKLMKPWKVSLEEAAIYFKQSSGSRFRRLGKRPFKKL